MESRSSTNAAASARHLDGVPSRLRAPDDVRRLAAQQRLARPTPGKMAARLVAILAGYVALATLGWMVDTWQVWVPVWAALAFLLLSCGAVMHEGVHGNLTGRRSLDRWLAFGAGWLILLPTAAYRPYHLEHHVTTMSESDPSGANAKPFKHRREYLLVMLLAGPGFTAQMWSIAVRVLMGRSPSYVSARHRRQLRTEVPLALALYAALAVVAPLLGAGRLVVMVWLVPTILGLCAVAPYVLLPEHYGAEIDGPILETTATVRSNPLLSFVYLNNNHHAAHHLVSSCNPAHLGRISDHVGERARLRYDSYTAFHRQVFSELRW